jgi:hypothetical protein
MQISRSDGCGRNTAKVGRLRQKFYDYLIFSNATACGLRVLPLRHRVGVLVGRIRRFPHVSLRSAGSIEGAVCREELCGRQGANGHPRRRRIHATADPVLPTAFTATLADMSCPLWSDGANAGRSDGSVDKKQVVVMRVTPSDSAEPAAPAEAETTPIYQDVAAAVRGAAAQHRSRLR